MLPVARKLQIAVIAEKVLYYEKCLTHPDIQDRKISIANCKSGA